MKTLSLFFSLLLLFGAFTINLQRPANDISDVQDNVEINIISPDAEKKKSGDSILIHVHWKAKSGTLHDVEVHIYNETENNAEVYVYGDHFHKVNHTHRDVFVPVVTIPTTFVLMASHEGHGGQPLMKTVKSEVLPEKGKKEKKSKKSKK